MTKASLSGHGPVNVVKDEALIARLDEAIKAGVGTGDLRRRFKVGGKIINQRRAALGIPASKNHRELP